MAESSTLKTNQSHVFYKIVATPGTGNISTNKTSVRVQVIAFRDNTWRPGTYGSGTAYCRIDGTEYTQAISIASSSAITDAGKTIFDRTVDISHGSDGKKTLTIQARFTMDSPVSSDYQGFSFDLATIPRAGTLDSFSGSSITGALTVKYTPKSSAFYNKIYIYVGSKAVASRNIGTKAASQQTGSLTLSASELSEIYKAVTTSASATLNCYLFTYTDSGYTNSIGSSGPKALTLSFPAAVKPSISFTAAEAGSSFGAFVQTKSSVRIAITAEGVYNSTITTYSTTVNDVAYKESTFTSNILTRSGEITITATVTDTRGRTASASKTITVLPYGPPTISAFSAIRSADGQSEDDNSKKLLINADFSIPTLEDGNANAWSIGYKREMDQSFTVLLSGEDYEKTISLFTGEVFSSDYTYTLRLSITDSFGTYVYDLQIPTSSSTVDYHDSGTGIAFGKAAEHEKTFELAPDWELRARGHVVDIVNTYTDGDWTVIEHSSGFCELFAYFEQTTTSGPANIRFEKMLPFTTHRVPIILTSASIGGDAQCYTQYAGYLRGEDNAYDRIDCYVRRVDSTHGTQTCRLYVRVLIWKDEEE